MALRAGCSDRSDLFLVGQQAAGCVFRVLHLQKGIERGKCADSVVLAISGNHAAVKAQVTRRAGRDNLQLRGEEVILFHIILLLQDRERVLKNRILLRVTVIALLRILLQLQRAGAHEQVEVLTGDRVCQILRHLVL